ncbi:MAG: imidazolonepropionase [Flavobacteriales bacterium]|nr:imidazolonepropionase [Flavobacteriia bacterium]NCP05537.1 imidazolonepropionase [Flavobacteriales bacterium]PIV93328.1 MAG: imidazolonepropionase [Flavobacteriaceae bacterium CG17_big_fil_post_rev_8_21_14_2_50_33_15]PIY10198.1 MAG: imidazolonepropionase [Flavobacteriaceae bacterium CG_4_10_14_3_um_filter_33_47]PJB18228.1 MAG: imidazolonepropionase [Flavobacteriaceae bacterium CG_4_9_14_3_um_filter_33_16]
MTTLFKNIKELIQVRTEVTAFVSGKDMNKLPTIKNAFLVVEDGLIANFGNMENCPKQPFSKVIDASGKMMLPSWCDSHTHLVYAGNREREFVDKIKGLSYQDIANKGGGILNSAKTLQETSENDLYIQSKARLEEVMALGTGAIEIKSGYGLTVASELKMLRVIKRLKENYPISIKATFLGAHVVPSEYRNNKEDYIKLLIEDLMPKIAKDQLADFVDVFCETGYFSVEDTERILQAGKDYGLVPKIHVNQFNSIGGIQAGVKYNALSVDHLEEMKDEDIESLKSTKTMPVALPGCSFFLGIPYTPARKMIDAGLPLALATDYNPGSSPSGNMNFVVSSACIKMKLTPEEAINAATINGAYAMGMQNEVGSIAKGKQANLILTKPINSYSFIPYSFGANQIEKVYLKGKEIK